MGYEATFNPRPAARVSTHLAPQMGVISSVRDSRLCYHVDFL